MSHIEERRHWMATLAKAAPAEIEAVWADVSPAPDYEFLRRPEVGLVMVRGRAGGTGGRFNMGEMTVTRCSVRLGGLVGHAYVAGRDARHAEIAAVLDALLQDEARRPSLRAKIIAPLAAAQAKRRTETGRRVAATKVEFFTLVRERE